MLLAKTSAMPAFPVPAIFEPILVFASVYWMFPPTVAALALAMLDAEVPKFFVAFTKPPMLAGFLSKASIA
jgi:hypothetical protein